MEEWSMCSIEAPAGALWAARVRGMEGGEALIVVSDSGRFAQIRGLGMTIPARSALTLKGADEAREAARLWQRLASDPAARFSEVARVGGNPVYALRKPPFEGDGEKGIFGLNGGGEMGLSPCLSITLPREGWRRMAAIGAVLAERFPGGRASISLDRLLLAEGEAQTLRDQLELTMIALPGIIKPARAPGL